MNARHGGDGEAEAARLGLPIDAILDASANIAPDPLAPEIAALLRAFANDPSALRRYPDPAYPALRRAAARRFGVAPDRLVVANGSAALLAAALRALDVRSALLPVPSFSEYAKALARERVAVTEIALDRANGYRLADDTFAACVDADACIVANPNNPTGASLEAAHMQAIVHALARRGIAAIVDEAFVDYVPDVALPLDALPHGTVVMRSMTKFNAIPGVRVGFAIADAQTASVMQSAIASWPIGAVDAALAEAVLASAHDSAGVRARNARRREDIVRRLAALGIVVFPSSANFVFCDLRHVYEGSADAFRRSLLASQRVLVRACDDYHGLDDGCYIRLAVLDDEANDRTIHALAHVLSATNAEASAPLPAHSML
jgi:threonine-phosphate decarboxylase